MLRLSSERVLNLHDIASAAGLIEPPKVLKFQLIMTISCMLKGLLDKFQS